MDSQRVSLLREALGSTAWMDGARGLAQALRRPTARPGGLLLVGTAEHEPWHLTAHLDDESRFADLPQLRPTLVRWSAPAGAPPHLSVTPSRLEQARRGETLFVVAPDAAGEALLTRAADARHRGATLVSLDAGDPELAALAHERMVVSPGSGLVVPAGVLGGAPVEEGPGMEFDLAQHLVAAAAGEPLAAPAGWRSRLERVLERISGPAPDR